jgi:RNA polymerase sigma factor (sigma-70 family)
MKIAQPDVVHAVPASDARSFEEFFLSERQELFGTLWLMTGRRHEAEELLQEAFVRVWERWDEVRSMERPTGYLYRTAVNVWHSRARRAAVALRRTIHAEPPVDAMAEVDARDVVVRALATLPPRQRAAVVLIDLLGFTSEEAAGTLGIRPSTARVQAMRARAALKERMDER